MINRRLIANLFLQFVATPRGDSKRFEMLSLIANILNFDDYQKEQAGLLRRSGALQSPGSATENEACTLRNIVTLN